MTREERISALANLRHAKSWKDKAGIADDTIDICIKALEQEPILDKIRAEITNIPITDTDGRNNNWYREPQAIINDVLHIIDKYKAESEGKE